MKSTSDKDASSSEISVQSLTLAVEDFKPELVARG